jgi:hypothetical protein
MAIKPINISDYKFGDKQDIIKILNEKDFSKEVSSLGESFYLNNSMEAINQIGNLLKSAFSTSAGFSCSKNVHEAISHSQSLMKNAAVISSACIQGSLKALKLYQEAMALADTNQLDKSMKLVNDCSQLTSNIKKISKYMSNQFKQLNQELQDAQIIASEEEAAAMMATMPFNEQTVITLSKTITAIHQVSSLWIGINRNCAQLSDMEVVKMFAEAQLQDEFKNELSHLTKVCLLLGKASIAASPVFNKVSNNLNSLIPPLSTTNESNNNNNNLNNVISPVYTTNESDEFLEKFLQSMQANT